ncbi:N-acetylmuramoyl-L-alanine amidase family protein [Bacillus mesophilum]|uniref:N-acetylmuramoyl-L-alanine amidase n=1 Tax=Bacillus mesophilum TaxID=1071718 RepID=A0A7V7RPI6_9BACI|nr:N-acetylmuramoyl-L-alanine amidase [Bacillus mesophilum]KAB2335098.1 N-acetylmuramoyl-L-alanine amidase [Bacillus mesophilum]
MVKIKVDPGHGGTDPGAVGNGLREKDLTLTISKKIRDMLLQYQDVQVSLTRETDKTLSLKQRTDMANAWGADFLFSIHINAGGGTGYEDFRFNKVSVSSRTAKVQRAIHGSVMVEIKDYNVFDRGAKSANFHMLRESNMPGVLTENLFIDRAADAKLLKNDKFLDAIARGHVNGLVTAFGLKLKQSEKSNSQKQEDDIMSQPFNPTSQTIKNSVSTVLSRFEQKDPALSKEWRDKQRDGELTISDAVGLLYVAVDRGFIQGK